MVERSWLDKQASEWTTQALIDLAGESEGQYLEYKKASEFDRNGVFRRNTLKKELTETASAFLNADGGVVLLGVQTRGPQDAEILEPLGAWSFDDTLGRRGIDFRGGQILDILSGNLMPRPRLRMPILNCSISSANSIHCMNARMRSSQSLAISTSRTWPRESKGG